MRGYGLRVGRKWWRMALPAGVAVSMLLAATCAQALERQHQAPRIYPLGQPPSGSAQPAPRSGAPFQRGDVFLTGSGSVQEYSPSGQLLQTVAGSSGAGPLCFNPDGTRLIVPGVGLFDSSGNLLQSNWASVTNAERCVADGSGNVYVGGGVPQSSYTITKDDLKGSVIHTFNLALSATRPLAMDLAPDECTVYYGGWVPPAGNGQLNVCTNSASGDPWFADDVRVLPNWQVLVTDDFAWGLADASGQFIRSVNEQSWTGCINCYQLYSMSLDPDNTSFWVSAIPNQGPTGVFRFDINSGRLLSQWAGSGQIAVYGPPLLGNANVQSAVDSDTAGTAEAFSTQMRYPGNLSRLHLYVDSSSTASNVIVGIYSNRNGDPGALLEQGTITNVRAGSWNYVDIPSMPVTAGQRYWIAVLGPSGAGSIRFRDAVSGPGSETSAQHNLTALPAKWSTGKTWATGNVSAYGS